MCIVSAIVNVKKKKKSKKFSLAYDTSVQTVGVGVGDILAMELFFQIKVTISETTETVYSGRGYY